MGWLRDYMQAGDPPISSFGQLADRALAHAGWPADTRPKPRSLATLFSKLDRGEQLDWLRDRLAVQQVLADLLSRPLGDLRQAIGEVSYVAHSRFLRLNDIRYGREVDLIHEPLPPGIPRDACDPPSWGPSWWIAGRGAGKSLVGTWLRSRGLAHVDTISSRDDLKQLPNRGPLFIEVEETFHRDGFRWERSDLDLLRAHARPLLIAHPAPPPSDLPVQRLRSPEIDDYLPDLVDWVAQRLDGTGHFHPDRAEQWMKRVALRAGVVESFGDVLGLLGMMDEVAPRTLLAKSLDEVGRHFVTSRLKEALEHSSHAPRLAQEGYASLLDCAGRALVAGTHPFEGSYSTDVWTHLLSERQEDDPPDPSWFTSALSGALGHQITKRDLKRAAQKVKPSAFALVQSLVAGGLLLKSNSVPARAESGAQRELHPRWLTSLLRARAARRILDYSSLEWGQVLLNGTAADQVILALLQDATREDFSHFFRAIEDFESDRAESVAAIEGLVIAAGLSALEGQELPEELIEALLGLIAETAMVLDGELLCRTTRSADSSQLFSESIYSCSITVLCRSRPFPLPHLDPIRTSNSAARSRTISKIQALVSKATNHIKDEARQPFLSENQIVGSLLALLELYRADTDNPPLPAPLSTALAWNDAEALHRALRICPLSVLIGVSERLGSARREVLIQLWKLLEADEAPDRYLDADTLGTEFWQAMPNHVLLRRLRDELFINWEALLPHQYADYLAAPTEVLVPVEALEHCPLDTAERAIERFGVTHFEAEGLGLLMARAPSRFAGTVAASFHEPQLVETLLQVCPPQATSEVSERLLDTNQLLRFPPRTVDAVRLFLRRAILERHPDFARCYTQLAEIERALWPLRRVP